MKELHEDMIAHLQPNTSWTFDPLQVLPTLLVAALYARRVLTLRARGTPVPRWRIGLFTTGIATLLVALVSPVHALGEQMFSFHMVQHVLLGDLAPLALLAGLTGPILRPALAFLHRLRFLAHPLVALPLWGLNLYAWHLPVLYQAALRSESVHALEHVLFIGCGINMWMPLFGPLPKPQWFGNLAKLGYIVAVRLAGALLGNIFIWSGTAFYSYYQRGEAYWGISALKDQGIAGSVMMIEGSFLTIGLFAWLFLKSAKEGEERQELVDFASAHGLELSEERAGRAVAAGRGGELRHRLEETAPTSVPEHDGSSGG